VRHPGVDLREDPGLDDQADVDPGSAFPENRARAGDRPFASPSVISYMSRVYSSASPAMPPTELDDRGAPAHRESRRGRPFVMRCRRYRVGVVGPNPGK